ncbi:MAG TPA: alpha/beta hydrolase [Candidatus Binataceae bacterium]|nr:alpha/beta hydrolase [Candidatus Binataceae bacterium]
MSELGEGDVDVRDVRLHYIDWGGSGAPIVLLHATGLLGRIYRPIAQALTAVGHVFSYDQRGHGDSGRAEPPVYDWAMTARDLQEFIRAMGLQGARAFGHSAGATAIGAVASRNPELITRAVLVEPVLFETPESPEFGWRNPLLERTLKRKRTFDSVEAMFANFERKPPYDTWGREILRDYCEYGTRSVNGKRELKCSPEIEARIYESSHSFDGFGLLLRSKIPMLIMFGQRPGESPGGPLAGRIASELKTAQVINFAEAGHFLPMEQAEEVGRLAADFLRLG